MQTETNTASTPELTLEPRNDGQLVQLNPQTGMVSRMEPMTPMHMISDAVARGASFEQISQLMDLRDRIEASEARKAFVTAMTAFKRNAPTIVKNKVADFKTDKGRTVYAYSDLANVCDVVIGALAEHGISHDWAPAQSGNTVTVTCTLTHELGHTKQATLSAMADQSGGKNAIQAIGSAVSYLERYTLLAACGIAVGDGSDDDGAGSGDRQQEPAARASSKRSPADVAASNSGKSAPASNQLLTNARAAADKGHAHFGPFFKECTEQQRKALAGEMADLTERANKAGK